MRIYSQSTLNLKWEKKKEKKTVKERRKKCSFSTQFVKSVQKKKKKGLVFIEGVFLSLFKAFPYHLIYGFHYRRSRLLSMQYTSFRHISYIGSVWLSMFFPYRNTTKKKTWQKPFQVLVLCAKVLSIFFRFFFAPEVRIRQVTWVYFQLQ